MRHPPEDDDWIKFANQEIDPKVWWLTLAGAVVLVCLCAGLVIICA